MGEIVLFEDEGNWVAEGGLSLQVDGSSPQEALDSFMKVLNEEIC